MRRTRRATFFVPLCALSTPVIGQGPVSLPRVDTPAPDQAVQAQLIAGDTLFVGGPFHRVGRASGSIAITNAATGEVDGLPPTALAHVWDAIGDGAGGWYIGGAFGTLGNTPRNDLPPFSVPVTMRVGDRA
jgi:hypothetical protein